MRTIPGITAILLLGGLAGCAAAQPPRELTSARQSYQRAATGRAAELAPVDLREARRALDRAERSFAYDPRSIEARWWAYIADRKARRAQAQAGIAGAERMREAAAIAYLRIQEELRAQCEAERSAAQSQAPRASPEERALSPEERALLGQREAGRSDACESELSQTREQMAAQREQLSAAERALSEALSSLREIATVRQEARGVVITLPGSVIFVSGGADLLPVARQQLDQVAEALKLDPSRPIVVEGHTDAIGGEDFNFGLSHRRAEAVRSYLVERGVPSDRVRAQGKGETSPIADNNTPEGRANNRRVEIILEAQK